MNQFEVFVGTFFTPMQAKIRPCSMHVKNFQLAKRFLIKTVDMFNKSNGRRELPTHEPRFLQLPVGTIKCPFKIMAKSQSSTRTYFLFPKITN